jgi:hypothetical protein
MTAPLVVGPLYGYRWWRVEWQGKDPVLRSLYFATPWPAQDPLRAACETKAGPLSTWVRRLLGQEPATHPAPTWACRCGIYGLARLELDDAIETSPQICQHGLFGRSVQVFGTLLLWGRVVQHEQGYRAEYAQPLKLLAVPAFVRGRETKGLLDAVAERYGIALVPSVEQLTPRR